ncbi:MAG: hypothetical protein ORN29_01750 [Rhodoferax sp.]|nr:hypothetical protein [Rhodoferax sp.]
MTTDNVLASFFPQWAQDLNTGLSFVGFLITAYTLYEIKRIKASFMARARLPDIIKELGKNGSSLNTILGTWPSQRNEARSHIRVSATLLNSALPMLEGADKKELSKIQEKLSSAAKGFSDPDYPNHDEAWDIYADIQSCITIITQVSKNMKWE